MLVHETAHSILHHGNRRSETTRTIRETEAEAVAFIVSHAIGLDTNSASSDYVQLYDGNRQILLESLTYIQQTASKFIAFLSPSE